MTTPTISTRKDDHLTLCAEAQVEFRNKTTLLEEVELLHDALSELSVAQIDLSSKLIDRALAAPLLITGMTGGAERERPALEAGGRVVRQDEDGDAVEALVEQFFARTGAVRDFVELPVLAERDVRA